MKHPVMVTVIIATYNSAHTLVRALESVFNQTYSQYEIIVVDDGSTDNTQAILHPYTESNRIRYVYQKNAGCGVARNRAAALGVGKYLAFLDADDYWHAQKLEQQVAVMEKDEEVIACYTESYCIDPFSTVIWQTKRDTRYQLRSGNIAPFLFRANPLTLASVLMRREVFDQVGGFTEVYHLMMMADYDLWLKTAPMGKFFAITTPLTYYQLRAPELDPVKRLQTMVLNYRQIQEVFWNNLGQSPFWYTLGWIRTSSLLALALLRTWIAKNFRYSS
jgi:glycosyltransferase involved in cell wall biosynthesis